jgi:hypothetical protein
MNLNLHIKLVLPDDCSLVKAYAASYTLEEIHQLIAWAIALKEGIQSK